MRQCIIPRGLGHAHRDTPILVAIDQPAELVCENCGDAYCEVCYAAQHRKGSRKTHVTKPIPKAAKQDALAKAENVDAVRSTHVHVSLHVSEPNLDDCRSRR